MLLYHKTKTRANSGSMIKENMLSEWDDFRTLRWMKETESIDLLIGKSRGLLEI